MFQHLLIEVYFLLASSGHVSKGGLITITLTLLQKEPGVRGLTLCCGSIDLFFIEAAWGYLDVLFDLYRLLDATTVVFLLDLHWVILFNNAVALSGWAFLPKHWVVNSINVNEGV